MVSNRTSHAPQYASAIPTDLNVTFDYCQKPALISMRRRGTVLSSRFRSGSDEQDKTMQPNASAERFLPVPVVLDRTSWSRAKLYDAVKKGEFPKPVKISANRIAWTESAVAGWIASKMEAA